MRRYGFYSSEHEESYRAGFREGVRIGRIQCTREILIKILKNRGSPSKRIIRKIHRETDNVFLHDLLMAVALEKMTVGEVEEKYDTIYQIPKDTTAS